MIQIRCFEETHESDLEDEVNSFLCELNDADVLDIKYSASHFSDQEQIFSFSCCVVYRIKESE